MELKHIILEKKKGVGYITINNPDTLNAMAGNTAKEIADSVNNYSDDKGIRAIVIRGANENFCGGGDVKAMKKRNDTGKPGNNEGIRKSKEMILSIRNAEKPVVAWLEGAVAGGGLSLALACDFLIADKKCKFILAFVNIGYVPDMGSTYLLTRTIGKVKATELFMLGNRFTGEQAYDMGIVTKAVEKEELEATVVDLVNKLKNGPTLAYARIKKLMNRALFDGLESSMENEREYQYYLSHTLDHQNAVNSFMEKKKIEYIGE